MYCVIQPFTYVILLKIFEYDWLTIVVIIKKNIYFVVFFSTAFVKFAYLNYIGALAMKLKDVLDIKSISLNADISDKKTLLDSLLDLACKSGKIINKEEVRREILKREELLPTGIGNGIALPHAKTNAAKETVVAFMTLKNPIEYGSLDGSKVKLCLLLIGKENNVGIHLRLLSRISRVLGNKEVLLKLQTATNPQQVIDIFSGEEE